MTDLERKKRYRSSAKGRAVAAAYAKSYGATAEAKAYKRRYYQTARGKAARARYDAKRTDHRAHNLKKAYGITVEQWQAMFDAQSGACAICRQVESITNQHGKRSLAVDHDHATGKVRGLLCVKCNFALTRIESVEDWSAKAHAYLAKSKES